MGLCRPGHPGNARRETRNHNATKTHQKTRRHRAPGTLRQLWKAVLYTQHNAMSNYQPYGGYNDGGYNNDGGFDSNTASSQPNKTQTRSSLTPVTIKMIIEAKPAVQDGDFSIHGLDLNFVSFTGIIRNVVDNTSNMLIQIEDGTSVIDVRKWVDEKSPEEESQFLVPGTYVYVTGSVKEFGGKTNISNTTFHEIKDYNQVIYHNLSVMDTYNTLTGKIGRVPGSAVAGNGASNSLFDSKPSAAESNSMTVADRILEVINENTPSMSEGVPIQFIAQELNLLVDDVQLHCAKLTEEAKIYVGYDENGYLAV